MAKKTNLFRANVLFDGEKFRENMLVAVEGDRITDVRPSAKSGGSGTIQADAAGWITPAFIDPHAHIGMFREGEPGAEAEGNDVSGQIMPCSDPLNSVYFDDRAFVDSVDFGVLYSCIVPGSGNIVGGRAKVIRTFAADRRSAEIKDYGFKMALGYNPRSTTEWKGERPNTRMGTAQMLERRFDDLLIKKAKCELARDKKLRETEKSLREKKVTAADASMEKNMAAREFDLEFSAEEKALLELLSGRKTIKVHVHKEDDALYLIELKKKYSLNVTADHCGDIFRTEIFNELADAGIRVVYGPLGSLAYKVELKHSFYTNTTALVKSRAFYGLMTDHPVIMQPALRDSLKFFMYAGLDEAAALSIITSKNAAILGLDDLGSVLPGKLASLTVWNDDPLHLRAKPVLVMGEGKVLRK